MAAEGCETAERVLDRRSASSVVRGEPRGSGLGKASACSGRSRHSVLYSRGWWRSASAVSPINRVRSRPASVAAVTSDHAYTATLAPPVTHKYLPSGENCNSTAAHGLPGCRRGRHTAVGSGTAALMSQTCTQQTSAPRYREMYYNNNNNSTDDARVILYVIRYYD